MEATDLQTKQRTNGGNGCWFRNDVVQAYYRSEIGIRQPLEYRGNVYLAEFSGEDVSGNR
jgi:hypothetical protein